MAVAVILRESLGLDRFRHALASTSKGTLAGYDRHINARSPDRLAWDLHWLCIAAFAAAYAAFAIARAGGWIWALAVAAPLAAAGANLVLYRGSHERICAIETARHGWLRVLTMGGYDRRTFLLTGVAEIALALFLARWIVGR